MEILQIDVLGSHPITFQAGVLTGHMLKDKKFGIGINTVMYEDGKLLGGAISYKNTVLLRDFLNDAVLELDRINAAYDWSENDN